MLVSLDARFMALTDSAHCAEFTSGPANNEKMAFRAIAQILCLFSDMPLALANISFKLHIISSSHTVTFIRFSWQNNMLMFPNYHRKREEFFQPSTPSLSRFKHGRSMTAISACPIVNLYLLSLQCDPTANGSEVPGGQRACSVKVSPKWCAGR
jgi:hypothetical protein